MQNETKHKIENENQSIIPHKYLIFDFDGVLARSMNDNIDMHIILGTYNTSSRSEISQIIKSKFQVTKHAKSNNLTPIEKELQLQKIQFYGKTIINLDIEFFWEFIKLIQLIPNSKLAVVSSGSSNNVVPNAKRTGLDFDIVLTAEDSLSKEDKVQTVCDYWKVFPKDCYYFTDTISDDLELKEMMGIDRIIGCGWGWSTGEALLTVLPINHILIDQDDVKKLRFLNK